MQNTRKIVLLSFDDGTVYDPRFVQLLNRYNIPCTFNLNSGLEDFVWYYEDRFPIRRQRLAEAAAAGVYAGHEIAAHTRTHPDLTALPAAEFAREVGQDCDALREAFGLAPDAPLGFAVPFTHCNARENALIRPYVRYIRLSEFTHSFAPPADAWHIYVNGLYNDPDIYEKLAAFAACRLPLAVFVLCGHSYEFEVLDQWDEMERLLQTLRSCEDFEFMTTMQFVQTVLG